MRKSEGKSRNLFLSQPGVLFSSIIMLGTPLPIKETLIGIYRSYERVWNGKVISNFYPMTSRGFAPSAGQTIPRFSSVSTTRAALPYQSFKCLWSILVEHFPELLTNSIADSITAGSSSPYHPPPEDHSKLPRSHSTMVLS